MASPENSERPIILSGRHLSPAAKTVVLAHALETVTVSLGELAQICNSLGEDALGREAQMIREAFLNRRKALFDLTQHAGKSLHSEKLKS